MKKNMFKRESLSILTLLLLSSNVMSADEYDIIKRAKLVDDRINSLEITRPIKHDFFFNLRALYAPEITDIISDAESFDTIDTSDTTQAIATINTTLDKYYDKEQIIKADLGIGFPLPSFRIKKLKVKPNFRFEGGVFAMVTPQKVKINMIDIITNLEQVPVLIREKVKTCLVTAPSPVDGEDLLITCVSKGSITQVEADQFKAVTGLKKLPYSEILNNQTLDTPSINMYAKVQAKAGLFNQYRFGKHFFGDFNLYGLARMDIQKYVDAIALMGGGADFEYDENMTMNLVNDFTFGYRNSNYSAYIGFEELKLAEISSEEASLKWGDAVLLRFHAQADYRVKVFKFRPYIGTHARSGYGFGQAFYYGVDTGVFVFKDRLGLNVKTQFDREHFTFGLRAKIWIIQAELTSKTPINSVVDGVKVSSYYGANIRLFF